MIIACYAPDHHRNSAMKHGMVGVIGLVVVDIIFAIPSIQLMNDLVKAIDAYKPFSQYAEVQAQI